MSCIGHKKRGGWDFDIPPSLCPYTLIFAAALITTKVQLSYLAPLLFVVSEHIVVRCIHIGVP